MRLAVTLVCLALSHSCIGHYYVLPVVGNGHLITPYHYVVQHHVQHNVPEILQHPVASAGSRETLEDQSSSEGFLQQIPDISDEQASLNPEDDQVPLRPYQPPQRPLGGGGGSVPNLPQAPSGEIPNVIFNGPQQDGSYDFSYSLGDQSRSEKSDANGNVQGTYSYTGADGKQVTITYTAGADKGYIPEGEGLLPPPVHPPGGGDGSNWGPDEQIPQLPQEPEDDSQHSVPVAPPRKVPGTKTHVQEPEEPASHGGMPYSYNYDAVLSSKKETADDSGNVEGSYTYVDGAGKTRTVTYTVKGDEGFVATGDIHPDPGSPNDTPVPSTGTQSAVPPPSWVSGGGIGVKGHPKPRPTSPPVKGHPPPPPPPVKGHPPTLPPPVKGHKTPPPVKGHPTPRPPPKGGKGWDKYPLGK